MPSANLVRIGLESDAMVQNASTGAETLPVMEQSLPAALEHSTFFQRKIFVKTKFFGVRTCHG